MSLPLAGGHIGLQQQRSQAPRPFTSSGQQSKACVAQRGLGSRRNGEHLARATSSKGPESRGASLDTLRRENEALKASIADAEAQVGQLEKHLDGESNGQGATAASPAPGSQTATFANAANGVGQKSRRSAAIEGGLAPGTAAEADAEAPSEAQPVDAADYWTPVQQEPSGAFEEQYGAISPIPDHDGTECLKWDDSLWSHKEHFKYRWHVYKSIREAIDKNEGGLEKFSQGYKYYGLNRGEHEGKKGTWYREWAPGARAISLVGEYNQWDPKPEHWAVRNEFGVWELFLPDSPDGKQAIPHRSKIKTRLETAYGEWVERIPAWIKWATQEWNEIQFNGVFYSPPLGPGEPGVLDAEHSYTFKYPRPDRPRALRIYECHVGMSSAEPKVNSYLEFARDMLPRIRSLGYNCVQIMAIQEHAYYGSFGYHVTNFFAASSRCGTPDELKAMIDEAHRLGLVVLMDIVHSHASKNTNDGINMFDGTEAMYFHGGGRGYHWMWDSRCFNYGNWETLRFLLSNSRWWIDEYKFDGYRFDGVTSMMYHHHGLQMAFTGNYDEYFGLSTDIEAVTYLMLQNQLLHDLFPTAITIGEDVSGMPTFCRPVAEGGVGFDYRLQMAIADKWIEVLSEMGDHDWDMGNIVHTLTNRRYAEACVGYAESHDQALVGDKTIAFWLMDAAMYDCMSMEAESPVVSRGIALHKMIRLITMSLGGESYLNFMGNEFGHPEWIDFPRDDTYDTSTGAFVPGNGGSLDKCRRRWDLADREDLRYKFMAAFDRAMNHLDKAFGFIGAPHTYVSRKDEGDKLIVTERGDLVMVFNFHPSNSYSDYRVGCLIPGDYKVVLSSDEPAFGGYSNVTKESDAVLKTDEGTYDNRPHSFQVYAPSRTVVVYAPAEYVDSHADQKPMGVPGLAVKGVGPYFGV